LEFRDTKSAKDPTGLIDLQLYPRRSASNVRQLAQKEAKRLGGQMSNDATIELGGVEAYEFQIPPKTEGNDGATPLRARFVKNGMNYLALYERAASEKTRDAFELIAKEIKLAAPTQPSDALRDRTDAPVELPAVKLVMDLPDPFRGGSDDPKRQEFRVINFANEKSEVEMTITPVSMFKESFETFLPTLGKSLARQNGWPEPPVWHRVNGKINIAYTELIPAGQDARGRRVDPMQLMLISANNAAQLLIVQYPGPAAANETYAKKWEQIAKSVRPEAQQRR
jgi:hypothetical protein